MLPRDLTADSFAGYPAEAKGVASRQIAILQRLPLAFVPLLLRELIVFDWKFPAERRELELQFQYLVGLTATQLTTAMAPFAQLRVTRELERSEWVNSPAGFSEQLSAHLWATGQIDGFRQAAVEYMRKATASSGVEALPTHRLGIVAIGQGVGATDYRLFRKLAPQGVYYTRVQHSGDGVAILREAVNGRASRYPSPYGHWYIDGGSGAEVPSGVARVSYGALAVPRTALQSRMKKTYEAPVFDPEAFRTMLARIRPEDIGMGAGGDPVLDRFQLSLLTEGSGTQVFATTFVQWAAREALRRAQPLTIMARFAPRQREKPMNELLAESQRAPELDPQGSLVDADMGAYYTWINQQRLAGAEHARFIAWFENHGEAVVVGPGFDRGKKDDRATDLAALAKLIA